MSLFPMRVTVFSESIQTDELKTWLRPELQAAVIKLLGSLQLELRLEDGVQVHCLDLCPPPFPAGVMLIEVNLEDNRSRVAYANDSALTIARLVAKALPDFGYSSQQVIVRLVSGMMGEAISFSQSVVKTASS